MYSGYRIAFDGTGSWNFDNDFAKNVVVFDVDKSSLSNADNCMNNFWELSQGPTYGINRRLRPPEKNFSIAMVVIVILCLMEKKPLSLKSIKKLSTFQLTFI